MRRRIRGLETERVTDGVTVRRAHPGRPARARRRAGTTRVMRAGLARARRDRRAHAGVEAKPGDDHVRVAGVRVDRDPAAFALLTPVHEARRVERGVEQAAAVERVAHGPGAVVAAAGE